MCSNIDDGLKADLQIVMVRDPEGGKDFISNFSWGHFKY